MKGVQYQYHLFDCAIHMSICNVHCIQRQMHAYTCSTTTVHTIAVDGCEEHSRFLCSLFKEELAQRS